VEFFGDEARRPSGFGGLPAHPHPDQVRASYRSAHEAVLIRRTDPWVLVSGMGARTDFYEYFAVRKFGLCGGSCAVHFDVWYLEASI